MLKSNFVRVPTDISNKTIVYIIRQYQLYKFSSLINQWFSTDLSRITVTSVSKNKK